MATKKLTIFCKERTNHSTGNKFITYSTKDRDDNYYDVIFCNDCENKHLVPKGKKPFVLVCASSAISNSSRLMTYVDKNGEVKDTIKRSLFIKGIISIEDYIEPDCDIDF